ncbi:hypothetical protein AB0E78_36255 [Streptomyces sp. NPDC032198]|uniref:hypothetical protein n=1 Tax=Streptomyces sp. NPDC032198 TaxID=3155127 RepID=UPI0033C0878C
MFNPDQALCHPRADHGGELRPVLLECRPSECRNITLTPDNTGTLAAEADRLDAEARTRPPLPPLPPLLLANLTRRSEAIRDFLASTAGTTP